MSSTKKGLGRGLNALFGDTAEEYNQAIGEMSDDEKASALEIDIDRIKPNKNQPRKNFDENALAELAASIKAHGVITPIVVVKNNDGFMIVAGERRYRAALLANLKQIPAVVRNYTDKKVAEVALIENLQREDLNPVEAAKGIGELMAKYKLTQEVVSEQIGKSRSAVANLLRLLSLDERVLALVESNRLSAGHARCLVTIEDIELQVALAREFCDNKYSVRDLEKRISLLNKPREEKEKPQVQEQTAEIKDFVQKLERKFSTKVNLIGTRNKGKIVIDYFSKDDLDRFYEMLEL